MPTCFPSRPSRVRIPSTGDSDDPLEEEAVRWCLVCTHSYFRWLPPFPDGSRLFSPFPVQARGCHLLRESPLLMWAAVYEDDRSPVMEGRSTCCFERWQISPLLPGVQAERLRKPTIEQTCRLFPPPIQVLPVVVPTCSATLVVCRWDQQRTTDSPCAVSAGAETAQGSCKGRRQNNAQPHVPRGTAGRGEGLSAQGRCMGACLIWGQAIPLEGHQAAPVTPQTHVTAQQKRTEQTDNRSPPSAQSRAYPALED